MKKQILILAFFIVAVLASTSNSFGQLLPGSAPRGLTGCVTDALHPKAGVSYPYTIDNTNGVVPDNYSWWITKNPQFIVPATGLADQSSKLTVTPGQLIATDATGGVDGKTINITWSPEILAATLYQGTPNIAATAAAPSPTFVAVMANGSCTNNIQVFEINPKPSFTVDITNVLPDASAPVAYGIDAPQCVGKVVGATYASSVVSMDYGTNVLYFEVIAANFVTSWKPTFQIMGGLTGTQTADISIYSTLAGAKLGTTPIEAGVTGLATNGTYPEGTALTADASVTNTALGVSVYVRVTIHNNKEESIAALGSGFILAVDGKDLTNQWDLVDATCVDPAAADQNDQATQTITPRPDVTNAIAPAPALNPDTFIPKN